MSARPRGSLDQPFEGFPAYGAVHEVIPSREFRDAIHHFAEIADDIFEIPFRHYQDPGSDVYTVRNYDPRSFYQLFDLSKLGVSVVEMDPSKKQAEIARKVWESKDFGAVEQQARNAMKKRTKPGKR